MRPRVTARSRDTTHQRGGSLPAPTSTSCVVEAIVTAGLCLGQDLESDRRRDREFLALLNHLQVEHACPLVVAGDLFSGWRGSSPSTVNFALDHLPRGPVYAVPGPQDVGLSGYSGLHLTAFSTLVKAGRVILLEPKRYYEFQGHNTPVLLHGFPHTFVPEPCTPHDLLLDVAVASSCVWMPPNEGDPETRARNYFPRLRGYHVAFFGGNPDAFQVKIPPSGFLVSCGERNVFLLYSDGSVKRHKRVPGKGADSSVPSVVG